MPRPDRIRATGLRTHLNSMTGVHKGRGYVSFVQMVEDDASVQYMARAFGVNKNTMYKWLKIYKEELNTKIYG